MSVRTLSGHISTETAHVDADYPYGFRLRCQRRVWVETKFGHGQRIVFQTSNPKKSGLVWNKPKSSTYSSVVVLTLDDESGHIDHEALGGYDDEEKIRAFVAKHGGWLDAWQKRMCEVQIARHRAGAKIEWTIHEVDPSRKSVV